MMKVKFLTLCACIAFFSSALNAAEFSVLKNSRIAFKVKKFAVMSVEGEFKEFQGSLILDEDGKINALSGEVAVNSVFSGDEKRDKHLLQADFLDEKKFPKMTLTMLSYSPESAKNSGKQKGKLVAMLNLHGKQKKVEFKSTLDTNSNSPQLALEGSIDIKDFGIEGSMMNANQVQIIINTKWQAR